MQPRRKTITQEPNICKAPEVAEEELRDSLIARHKGKVQFIDFWATWCGGCRKMIKEYEPVKKEQGEEVTFVYLTGPSSIEKTWKILMTFPANTTGKTKNNGAISRNIFKCQDYRCIR